MRSLLALCILMLVGCGSSDGPHKPVAAPAKATAGGGGTPGYDTVKPLFQKYCSACHPGQQANNWLDFAQAKANAANIKLRVWTMKAAPNQMPKAGSPQSTEISDGERKTIADWVDAGAPEKGSSGAAASAPPSAATVASGKLQACFSCHGEGGRGNPAQAAPAIGGQKAEYIFNQLSAFQTTMRVDPSGAMNAQMADKTEEQMREYANELAKLPAFYEDKEPAQIKDLEKFEAGKTAAEGCLGCHGRVEADPSFDGNPYLSGQGKVYLKRQLTRFREKTRKNEIMNPMAESLTDENIEALATYFSQSRLPR